MVTLHADELLQRLRLGKFEPEDVQHLEHAKPLDLRAEFARSYRWTFQERRLKNKWDVGLAKSVGYELVSARCDDGLVSVGLVVPVFRNCLFLSGDGESVSGIATATRIIVRPVRRPVKGISITIGRGFSLDRSPDGWAIKPIKRRTSQLSESLLTKYGWRFDAVPRLCSLG